MLGEEIYIIRGADNVTLSDIHNDPNKMAAPLEAMINLSPNVFGSPTPICKTGNVAGVAFKEGPTRKCETHGARRTSADRRLYGYADVKAYHTIALKNVNAYLATNQTLLINSTLNKKSIKTLAQARAALERLDESLARFHKGLRATIKKVQPGAQRAAGKRVQEKVGALLEKNERYRQDLEATIRTLALDEEAMAFWDTHLAPVASIVQEVAGRQALPEGLSAGKQEAEEVDALVTRVEQMSKRIDTLEPEVKKRVVAHVKRAAKNLTADIKRVVARQEALHTFVAIETKKAAADQMVLAVNEAVSEAKSFKGSGKKALATVSALDVLLTDVNKALGEPGSEALNTYRASTLEPVRQPLIAAMEAIEPHLEGPERLKRLQLTFERIPEPEVTIASSAEATAHVERLMKSDDKPGLQMEMLKALAEYRNRVMTLLAEHVDAAFRCDIWEDCESPYDMKRAEHIMSSLYALPRSVKGRVKNRSAKAFATDLLSNGYGWQWPDEESDTGDSFNGPWVVHKAGSMRSTLKSALTTEATLWLSCREEQVVGNYVAPKVLLKSCARAAKGLSQGPLMTDIKDAVLKAITTVKHEVNAKQCNALHRKYRRAFFADALDKECKGLKERETREREIAKWQKKIQAAIKRKQFGKARQMLPDLTSAGAQDWVVKNLDSAIDQAIEYDQNRKAHKAAQKRAKRLMSRLPSFESTCKVKKKAYLYSDKQVRNAARRGRPQTAQRHEKKKWAAATKACEAKQNVLEVYQIYKSWGNDTAADAVLRGASTCMRFWRCN